MSLVPSQAGASNLVSHPNGLPNMQIDVRDLLQQGLSFHQQGDLSQAQNIYLQVLKLQPQHFDALHLLGVIAAQQNDHQQAENMMAQALNLDASHDFVWANRGNALRELKRWSEARDCFMQAVTLNPSNAEAWNYLGDSYRALNQADQALESYQQACLLNHQDERALLNLAQMLRIVKREPDALEAYSQAIAAKPQNAETYRERGNLQLDRGMHHQAILDYDCALRLQAQDAQSLFNRGVAFAGVKRFQQALESYDAAMQIDQQNAYLHFNRGVALEQLGRFEEALQSYEEAIARKVDFMEAHLNRGNTLKAIGRLEESVFAFGKMIAMNPNYAEAYNNRANGLKKLGRLDEAMLDYDQAIKIKADYHEAYNNRGNMLKDIGFYEPAMRDYDQALALKPDYISCRWNKSLLLILQGNYLEGWQLYEWRIQEPSLRDKHYQFAFPGWRGEFSLAGKTILIYAEQGYGDVVQFCRYLPMLQAQGANIIFEVFQPLKSLMQTMHCSMTVISKGEPLPSFDTYCPVMSLPHALKTTLHSIPAQIPYLYADADKLAAWQQMLPASKKMRVGLVWSGSTKHENDVHRSLPLHAFADLLALDVEWHSLHKEYRLQDQVTLEQYPDLQQHQDSLQDFADTAALVQCMDLVITVDTSVAHVAGALGKPVWILIPFAPDYRWLLERTDSPWYATARLFRQEKLGDWQGALAQLLQALKQAMQDASN